jgi:hypothetical protein
VYARAFRAPFGDEVVLVFQIYVYVAMLKLWFAEMFLAVLSYLIDVMVLPRFLPVKVARFALCFYGWFIVNSGFVQIILPQREVGLPAATVRIHVCMTVNPAFHFRIDGTPFRATFHRGLSG